MNIARIVNAVFWLYMWLSDVMQPVLADGNFWTEKGKQLFRFNSHFDNLPRLIGNAIIPLVLGFVIDWVLRRSARKEDYRFTHRIVSEAEAIRRLRR